MRRVDWSDNRINLAKCPQKCLKWSIHSEHMGTEANPRMFRRWSKHVKTPLPATNTAFLKGFMLHRHILSPGIKRSHFDLHPWSLAVCCAMSRFDHSCLVEYTKSIAMLECLYMSVLYAFYLWKCKHPTGSANEPASTKLEQRKVHPPPVNTPSCVEATTISEQQKILYFDQPCA